MGPSFIKPRLCHSGANNSSLVYRETIQVIGDSVPDKAGAPTTEVYCVDDID